MTHNELKRLLEESTPGPWGWFGNESGPIYLSTIAHGRRFVMTFEVSTANEDQELEEVYKWAQPCFQVYDDRTDEPWTWSGKMTPASELSIVPRSYRDDITSIAHPDARLIALLPELLSLLADALPVLNAAGAEELLGRFAAIKEQT